MPRTMALVGAGLAVQKGEWFFDRIDEIYRRSSPHTPERFLRECRAMAAAQSEGRASSQCAIATSCGPWIKRSSTASVSAVSPR